MDWIDITEASQIPSGSPGVTLAWRHYAKRGKPAAELTINARLRAELDWQKGMALRIQVAPDRSRLRLVPGDPGKRLGGNGRASAVCHRLDWIESEPRAAERVPHRIEAGALILELPDWARPAQGRAIPPAEARKEAAPECAPMQDAVPVALPVPGEVPQRKWTSARLDLLGTLWPDLNVTPREILERINALPGPPFAAAASLYEGAKRLGVPTSRFDAAAPSPEPAPEPPKSAPQPAASPVHTQTARATPHAPGKGATLSTASQAETNRREVAECMAAGMGARQIADETGIGLNEVSNIVAAIRAEQQGGRRA